MGIFPEYPLFMRAPGIFLCVHPAKIWHLAFLQAPFSDRFFLCYILYTSLAGLFSNREFLLQPEKKLQKEKCFFSLPALQSQAEKRYDVNTGDIILILFLVLL